MSFFISFITGTAFFYLQRLFPLTGIILLISFACLSSVLKYGHPSTWRHDARRMSLMLCGLFAAALAGILYARLSYTPAPALAALLDGPGETLVITGSPKSEALPLNTGGAFSQLMEISAALDSRNRPLAIREMRVTGPVPLMPGKRYTATIAIPASAALLNPGASAKILSGYITGVRETGDSTAGFFSSARLRLNHFLAARFSAESAPFLMSIITGERRLLTREMSNAFNATGLAHILSISGAHFGLLLFVLFRLFKGLIGALPYPLMARVSLYVTPSQIAALLSVPVVTGYLGISDMSFPAVRSFIMILLFLFGLLVQRRGFWLNTIVFAATVILLMQPDALLDLSFQLSFIAVLCIGIATDASHSAEAPETPKLHVPVLRRLGASALNYIRSSVLLSLAATAGTAPLVAHYFHYFSLVSPLTNLVITPLIGFLILPPALLSSFFFLATGYFPLLYPIDRITSAMLASVRSIARWNYADMAIPAFPPMALVVFYGALLLYILFVYRSRAVQAAARPSRAAAVFLVVAVSPFVLFAAARFSGPKGLQVTYLDVGQGDAAVIELPDGKTLVMDTGKTGFQVAEFLRYRGIRRIDAMVFSHGQFDHVGGVGYLLENFRVGEIWDNGRLVYPDGFAAKVLRRSLQRGDTISGNGYSITVLHTYRGFYSMDSAGSDDNNDSLVLRVRGAKHSFLFTGDIEKGGEEDMAHLGKNLKSSVLKVPHHGSRTSASAVFLHAVSPDIAVISVGRGNRYGHPHGETLALLGGARIFRTDRDGAVGIAEDGGNTLSVKVWRDINLSEAKNPKEEWENLGKLFRVW
jgi:competence protein ComEC